MITPKWTALDTDGGLRDTPADAFAGGIGAFLDRLAPKFGPSGGVILIDYDAAETLGLPTTGPLPRSGLKDHHAAGDALSAGWQCSGIGDWSKFWGNTRPTLHIGLTHLFERSKCPLWTPWPPDTVAAFRNWHELTGTPWHLSSGVSGVDVLTTIVPAAGKGSPTWRPATGGPDEAAEQEYTPGNWRARIRAEDAPHFAHGYDANRGYVGAASSVEVCPWQLRFTGKRFDRTRAGWWYIQPATWNDPRLPDPAGYRDTLDPGAPRWVTTPTLTLLEDLTAQGLYGGARVLDSKTGPGKRLFREWSERMRDAYLMTTPGKRELAVSDAERTLLETAVKEAGRAALGEFDSATHWAYRPDWWHAVIAQFRCNLWRRMHRAAREEQRYPLWIDTDNVWYGSDDEDWEKSAPSAFPIDNTGRKLGHYKHKGTMPLRRRP